MKLLLRILSLSMQIFLGAAIWALSAGTSWLVRFDNNSVFYATIFSQAYLSNGICLFVLSSGRLSILFWLRYTISYTPSFVYNRIHYLYLGFLNWILVTELSIAIVKVCSSDIWECGWVVFLESSIVVGIFGERVLVGWLALQINRAVAGPRLEERYRRLLHLGGSRPERVDEGLARRVHVAAGLLGHFERGQLLGGRSWRAECVRVRRDTVTDRLLTLVEIALRTRCFYLFLLRLNTIEV